MKRCERCNVNVITDVPSCPLCGRELLQTGGKPAHQSYPELEDPNVRENLLIRLSLFVSIIGCVVCGTLNFLINPHRLWSVIVIVSILYLWLGTVFAIKKRHNIGMNVFFQVLALSILLPVIDYFSANKRWAINYVVPGLVVAGVVIIITVIILRRKVTRGYGVYLLATALLGVIPVVCLIFGFATVLWPSLSAALFSMFTFIGFFLLGDRHDRTEIKKKFHI